MSDTEQPVTHHSSHIDLACPTTEMIMTPFCEHVPIVNIYAKERVHTTLYFDLSPCMAAPAIWLHNIFLVGHILTRSIHTYSPFCIKWMGGDGLATQDTSVCSYNYSIAI